jgi:hypothetical protein
MSFPDETTALRGLLAPGVAERAIRNSGEAPTRQGDGKAIKPFRKTDGSYVSRNEWRFLVSQV